MNLDELEQHIKEYNLSKDPLWEGVDYENDCVNYETAAWLFDIRFNEPCLTYFHNEDDLAGYPEGTPERDQWEGREWNWEICMHGAFLNYPDNFVVRHRYARPTCIQVLKWLEEKFGMRIFVGSDWVVIDKLPKYFDTNNRAYVEWEGISIDPECEEVHGKVFTYMAHKALKLAMDHMIRPETKKDLN